MIDFRVSLAHQINPSNAQHAALALSESRLLHELITPIAYNPDASICRLLKLIPASVRLPLQQELSRRRWLPLHCGTIQNYPWQEIVRVLLTRTRLTPCLGLSDHQLVDWVYTNLDRQIANHHLHNIDAIYTYEDLAATTFQTAKAKGILCLYDLPIPFYRMKHQIMSEEAERFPQFISAIQSIQEPEWKLQRKEQEVQLADHIFVASSVTKRSLLDIGVNSNQISVIPYGAPVDLFHPQPKPDDRFRALFVGRISPRKGIHYLMQAWQQLNLPDAELVLVGSDLFPPGWLDQYRDICHLVPSVPHLLLNQYYSAASVLVFPSLIEGFGLVILEAMACGIPVITTPNTGGIDILTDGVEGFIVPIRDVAALQEKLEWCYRNPAILAEMGRAARRKAEKLNWQLYRQALAQQVQTLLTTHADRSYPPSVRFSKAKPGLNQQFSSLGL